MERGWRKFFHNPWRLLRGFVRPGMTVLDFGCGPGFFSMPAAEMVGPEGRVMAVDLQQGMLDLLAAKIAASPVGNRVSIYRCEKDRIGVEGPVDFALAMYVIHEVPDKTAFFREIFAILRPGARMLVGEPKHHVDENEFSRMKKIASDSGFECEKGPKLLGSRTSVLTRKA